MSRLVFAKGAVQAAPSTGNLAIFAQTNGNVYAINDDGTITQLGVAAGGSVTSVGVTAGSNKLSVSGSPITSSGNITVDVDQANLSLGSIGGSLNLASQVTGALGITNGGTGLTSVGSSGQVLTVVGGVAAWATPSSGFADPTTSIGDMIFRNSSNNTTRLPIGTTGQVLEVVGGVPTWSNASTGTVTSVGLTATSSKITVTGSSPITTSGSFGIDVNQANLSLTAIGGTLTPVKGGTGLTTYNVGDILYGSASNTLAALPLGTNGYVLTVNGGNISWQPAASGGINGVTIQANGVTQGTALSVQTVNFTGSNITATVSGTTATVAVPAGAVNRYTFDVLFSGSGTVSSVSNLPVGWSASTTSTSVIITTNLSTYPVSFFTFGQQAGAGTIYQNHGINVTNGPFILYDTSVASQFQITSMSVANCATANSGTVIINVFF